MKDIGGVRPMKGMPAAPKAVDWVGPIGREADGTEWDAYVLGHPDATVDHLWRWRRIFERVFGHTSLYLAARRDRTIVGILPLVLFRSRLFGRAVVSVPFLNYGGLLTDDPAAAAALVSEANRAARDFRASHVELRHTRRQLQHAPHRDHKVGLLRTLPATVDELWTETDRKVRNQVRKAEKDGLVAIDGGLDLVDDFYSVFARNMRDLGTPVYSKRLFVEVLREFSADARVFLVKLRDRAVAGAIAIHFRGTVIVPWASSLREARQHCPNMLLYWSMLRQATSEGIRTFDFGRSSVGSGTHQFKVQWGASEVPLFWEYPFLTESVVPDHGPTNPKFRAAIAVWRHCPLWFTNTVGPHLVRAIP